MDAIIVNGGIPLCGTVQVQGSKNAALPMMAAAVLHEGMTILHNCPQIMDVYFMTEILKCLGASVYWQDHTLYIDGSKIHGAIIPAIYGVQMRSSITLMGSLMGRMGRCDIPFPGGCVIGRRPIDIHIQVLRSMGAHVEEKDGILKARKGRLHGFTHGFVKRSVGATENAVMAAVRARGSTYLTGCSTEPEITHLCRFLEQMGVHIKGIGTPSLRIDGGGKLQDVEYTVPSDRIVAGTYLLAGAATRGVVTLEQAPIEEMTSILSAYEKMGGQYKVRSGKLVADSQEIKKGIPWIETDVYPGLPTDLQSPLMAVLAGIPEASVIRETIFEDRYKIVSQLARMGAQITVDGRDAVICGIQQLSGAQIHARELRGGAALVVAALSAKGITRIENLHYIERGYEDICGDIRRLGGDIKKDKDEETWGEKPTKKT